MLSLQNNKLKNDLNEFVNVYDKNTNDFGYYLVIYDFLEHIDNAIELQYIINV